jgi:hypothetical protein
MTGVNEAPLFNYRVSMTMRKSLEYCRDLVRYSSLWSIHAFNIETALLREQVSDSKLGQMRILWWKQSIEKVFNVSLVWVDEMMD